MKMDKKAMMTSSTCSSDVYPRMHESMVIIRLLVTEKVVEVEGRMFVGVWHSSMMKFWKICLILTGSSVMYRSNKFPMDRGVRLGPDWI